jgi:hypothetical protein
MAFLKIPTRGGIMETLHETPDNCIEWCLAKQKESSLPDQAHFDDVIAYLKIAKKAIADAFDLVQGKV